MPPKKNLRMDTPMDRAAINTKAFALTLGFGDCYENSHHENYASQFDVDARRCRVCR